MNTYQLFLTAMRSLNHHKMRSLLTTLGIIVGVISIIAVMSIGEGAKDKVQKEIEGLGTNFIIVLSGSPKRLAQSRMSGAYLTLKPEDYEAIIEECDDVALASPGVQKIRKVIYEGNNWQPMIGGVNEHYLQIRNWPLVAGRFFTKYENRTSKKVAVIGQTVYNELFDNQNPIGKIIRIKKLPFKVIGVLEERGKLPDGRDEDDIILIPLRTMQRKVEGIHNKNFAAIIISAKNKTRMNQTASEIRSILRQQHKLKEDEDDNFTIFTQNDISQASDAASAVLNILLLIIASISLIVGGIGIMNIMLVSVTERTREIGIRMAIGATTQTILNQFIIEAITICLMGGLLGITFGILIAKIVGYFLAWPIFISIQSIAISISSSVLIGLFFGYYPAKKASCLNPVEALLAET
ncbi:FtsX-like permease family protein [Candidatus Dependentiae bacterium]|nr:FtsX-like permease family protein [Candidatus Dependentiae bacterium]